MKNASLFLLVSLVFAMASCEDTPLGSADSAEWHRMTALSGFHGGHYGLHRGGQKSGAHEDDCLAEGRGLGNHRRGDMNRLGRRGEGRGLHDGRGMRGEGRGMRDGRGMGNHRRGDMDRMGRRGEGRGMRGEGRHLGPPAEAISACEQKSAGDACSFVIENETVQSTCSTRRNGEGPLACRAGKGTHRRNDPPAK